MSIPFSQSMQSLHADHGRTSLWGIGLAISLLLLWGVWFFTPSLTVHTTGSLIGRTRSGDVLATFGPQASSQLRPGQAALIYPANTTSDVTTLPATILEVELGDPGEAAKVRLYPESIVDVDILFANGVSGEVTVETETISPAVLLLRATGQLVETPPVALSPQD
jgi:hypothetical protein